MEEEASYADILRSLTDSKKKRDPRALRLAAVTSALVEVTGEDPSPAAVYAKAVTALEGTLRQASSDSLSTQVALLELLQVTVAHVSRGVLAATLSLTSRVVRAVKEVTQAMDAQTVMETKDELGGANAVLRATCRLTTEVLRNIDKTADEKVVKQLLTIVLLGLFEDRRPKVRKAAHGGVHELLMQPRCHAVVRRSINQYAHHELVKAKKNKDAPGDCLHLLAFLEHSILYLDYSKLAADMMELFAVLIGNDEASAASNFVAPATKVRESTPKVLAISSILSTMTSLLRDESEERAEKLSELAPRVLASLLQASPALVFRSGRSEFDILQRGRTLYGQAILASCELVVVNQPDMATKLLPLVVQMILMLSKPPDENPDDATVADALLSELTQLFRGRLPALLEADPTGLDHCLIDVLKRALAVTDTLYRPTWSVSLKALVVLMQVAHKRQELTLAVSSSAKTLVESRNQVPPGSPSQHAVEEAFAALVQGVGLEDCWGWIEWNVSGKVEDGIDVSRAWILSKLRSSALAAQPKPLHFAFFQKEILTLARACDKLAATSKKNKNLHHARVVDLWSLFACFAVAPADMQECLPSLIMTFSRAVSDTRYPQLVPIICGGLSSLATSLEDRQASASDLAAMSEGAEKLLPVFFKLVSSQSSQGANGDAMQVDDDKNDADAAIQTQSIAAAITSLAKFAPKDFVHSLFKKLMHRVLEAVQAENSDSARVCSLLSLCQALVTSQVLEESDISFLYRALKPLIRNDEHVARVQKRAYKVLAEVCLQYHSFVAEPERLKELASLLTTTIMTSQVSARYMRLKCMGIIVDGFDEGSVESMNTIFQASAEILLCLKDPNGKTREAAYELLIAMASRGGTTHFLKTAAAALGAETSHMRSAAVMAISRIVYEFAWEDMELKAHLPSLLKTVLILINEDSREVVKSVVGFIRICVAAIPAEQLQPLLPELVGSLLKYHKTKDRFRAKIKIVLKKLVKLFGYDKLLPFVPESETRLLTHMRKLEQREKRKKEQSREEQKPAHGGFDDMLDSDEEDSDDGRTLMSGATGFSRMTGRTQMTKATGRTKQSKPKSTASGKSSAKTAIRLPSEADGDVVDMLGQQVSRRVKFAEDQMDDDSSDDEVLEFSAEGKLVIHDDAEEKANFDLANVDESPNKRRRVGSLDDLSKSRKTAPSTKPNKRAKELGAAYKSKKAGGDVKKKGQKYEPYAFVPLDGRSYSKKNRRSAVEQMSSVVRGAGKRKR